ncbi:MAG: hypothetical protein HYV51_00285 [Parcubacteria group bacterium]|nr:hypothetical protein [Parcubacteria group bacterium]
MNQGKRKDLSAYIGTVIAFLIIFVISGCTAVGSITQKDNYKFETTGLFIKPCQERADLEKSNQNKKSGFFAKFKTSKEDRAKELNTTLNCNEVDIERMVAVFNSIKESDEENGILGDSIEEVKSKGFTIHLDNEGKTRRPSTEILYGADALAEVGMPLNPPQLNTPEAIEIYKKYMKSHLAWTFKETKIGEKTDRFYINTKNASTIGPNYKFVITYKNNHVFRRVTKGGPQNRVTQEKAFLLGPGEFIGDLLTGGVNKGINLIK